MIGSSLRLARGEVTDAVADVRRGLMALGVFSGCINLLLLMPAVYMLQVYDRVLTSRNEGTLIALSALLAALLAIEALLDWVRSRLLGAMGQKLGDRLEAQVFDASFKHALSGQPGSPNESFRDLAKVREFIAGKGLLAIFDAPWAPIFLIVIFLLDTTLGLFATAAMMILVALAWYNRFSTGAMMADAGRLSSFAEYEATARLRNIEIISALGMLDRFRDRWLGHQQRIRQLATDLGNQAALLGSASRYSRLLLQSGILGVGAWLVLHGQLTAGGMIAASILLGRALSPFELLIAHWGSIAKTKESALRLSALLTLRPPLTPHVILPRPSGKISVENLVIGPPGHRTPTVRNLSLEVEPGTLVGIVGPSGSGKSTVGRALLGVWQPLSGAVRIDGAAIHQLDREDIGRWLGYLPQDVELFDGTIAENIARFGNLDSAKIIEAAQKSGVHEMILRMPKGYETPIGSGGTVLSGGQRQRIGLARAVFGDPSLIVLDEPNSSLDEAGDEALITALKKLKAEQRTVFVISHRVNVLRLVDQIIVLDTGNLKLVGSRDHVLKAAQEARALSNAVGA